MKTLLTLFTLTISCLTITTRAQPDHVILNKQELSLAKLINKYREHHGLKCIPLSKSLSYVAQLHVKDLYHNKPYDDQCNLHSWSGAGQWTPCCYTPDDEKANCMWNKPRELTAYNAAGFECTYVAFDGQADAPEALKAWQNSPAHRNVLLNKNHWTEKEWQALGVGIYKQFAVIWLGNIKDPAGQPLTNILPAQKTNTHQLNKTIANIQTPKHRTFYLIVGSFSEKNEATKCLNNLNNKGYNQAGIITGGNGYRVFLGKYNNKQEAQNAKNKHKAKHEDIWILNP